jgi:hypothetical protein
MNRILYICGIELAMSEELRRNCLHLNGFYLKINFDSICTQHHVFHIHLLAAGVSASPLCVVWDILPVYALG